MKLTATQHFKAHGFSVYLADFRDSIKAHKNDCLYLDPPYANGNKLYGKDEDHNINFDHTGLSKLLHKKDGWLLSYNNCGFIRELYDGYDFVKVKWNYGMNNSKTSNEVVMLSKDLSFCIMTSISQTNSGKTFE